MKSVSITKLIGEIVRKASRDLEIELFGRTVFSPELVYIFGNSRYIKEQLDEYSKGGIERFPLVALLTPVREERGLSDCSCKATINILIACSTSKDYSNEERERLSFELVLRPIYRRIIEEIRRDNRIRIDYDENIHHSYAENYSYGRYGAFTESGEAVSEPIDAINISSMELKLNKPSCR